MDPISNTQFSLASDPGIPSANDERVPSPMPISANNMTGDPNDRSMYESFATRKNRNTNPRPSAVSTNSSSTFKAQ